MEKKNKVKYAGLKKFVAFMFLKNKSVHSKAVITQVQELIMIIHDLLNKGMMINETFQVVAVIKELPSA